MATTGVIDADGHIRDDEATLRRYLDPPYNERVFLGGGSPRDGWDNSMGGSLGTRAVDADVWLDALDRGPMEQTVLFPTGGLGAGWLREPDFAVARCRAAAPHHSRLRSLKPCVSRQLFHFISAVNS